MLSFLVLVDDTIQLPLLKGISRSSNYLLRSPNFIRYQKDNPAIAIGQFIFKGNEDEHAIHTAVTESDTKNCSSICAVRVALDISVRYIAWLAGAGSKAVNPACRL